MKQFITIATMSIMLTASIMYGVHSIRHHNTRAITLNGTDVISVTVGGTIMTRNGKVYQSISDSEKLWKLANGETVSIIVKN